MAEDEYNRKLESLQQYIPFLNNMIVQLRDPRKKNREQQLAKMVSLHSMITDKKKKLKLETLIKCEDVILKLHDKVKSGTQLQLPPRAPPAPSISASQRYSPITPSSPSPPRDIPMTKPVVIPTEKVIDRDSTLCPPSSSNSFKAKIDIYSSAADSLKSTSFVPQAPVFGEKAPDMSKPPISLEDLEALQDDNVVDTEKMSLHELTDLREKLQKQLSKSDDNKQSSINTTVRNTTILTKKAVEKATPETKPAEKIKTLEAKQASKTSPPQPPAANKPVKVIKEAASIFGNALSSIDNKLLEGAVTKKDKERRSSTGADKSKERRSSKDEKRPEASSHKSPKDKTDKKHSSEHKKDKKDDEKKPKDKKDEKKEKEHKDDKEKKKEDDKTKPKEETTDKSKPAETTPVYKRLADKYNPKPRKHPVETQSQAEVSKNVSENIESSMKASAAPIPFLDTSQTPSSTKPHIPPQTLINVPLLSPSSSTNSIDNEILIANKKPISILPQNPHMPNQQNQIPTHVSNILANPNATALINNVVNQFKGRQTPAQNHFNNHPSFGNNFPPNEMGGNMHFNNQGPGNYWANQPQPPQNQNFAPQRSFTPLPNQMDFYPQNPPSTPNPYGHGPPSTPNPYGPPPTPNPYGHQGPPVAPNPYQGPPVAPVPYSHQGPPMLSPQYERSMDDGLFGNKDRDMRNRDDWRRAPSSSYRDPRLHRDQRSYRDETRPFRRDSRENGRESRPKFRDPRLNRYSAGSSSGRYERSERSQTPNRSRSRSISRDSRDSDEAANNTFASPLDSLYSNSEGYRRTGKGYGMQNFRIPKIKREEPEGEKEAEAATKLPEAEAKAPETTEQAKEAVEAAESPPKAKVEDNAASSSSVSSSTECESKPAESEVGKEKESAGVGEISSTNDIQENESRDDAAKIQDQTEIINKFLKRLLENDRTRAAASLFIDNVSNSLDDEKLKEVVKTVKSATVEEAEEEAEEEEEEEEEKEKPRRGRKKKVIVVAKKRQMLKKKLRLRRGRRRATKAIKDDDDDDEPEEEKEEVEEEEEEQEKEEKDDVKVNIRKPRKKGKHRTELDLLHEDIQDMFIRDGVLTATGKRMCRLLKNEETKPAPVQVEPRTRRSRLVAEKFDSKSERNSDKLKVMSNVRVLIPKISVDKLEMDEDGQRYSLRRSNKANKSYVEDDSDEDKAKQAKKSEEEETVEETKEEVEEPVEEEKPKTPSPRKIIHRKRTNNWASGIIPKRKKKEAIVEPEKTEETESEAADKSLELIEPDKNYFSAKPWHFKTPCKLCSFDGKNITKHYRTKHHDSEVLSSRLSPTKAEEAIAESLKLGLDESADQVLPSTRKFSFKCRFCDLDMHCKPSNFYDHISTHTGEYRHLCNICNFGACNVKPLRVHYVQAHGKDRDNRSRWVKNKVYGYLCLECNYVQIQKKLVENHVNIYHLGEGKKILKIYLSSIDHALIPPRPLQRKVEAAEDDVEAQEEEDEHVEESQVISKKFVEKRDDKAGEEPSPKKAKLSEEIVPKEEKLDLPEEIPEKIPHTPIKKEREIDMTVFTCNTNLQEENEKIEQERLKKMTELNDSVKTNRQSLNFVEQLSNRLLQEREETETPDAVVVKTEPEEQIMEPELILLPEVVIPKKPSKSIEPSSNPTEVAEVVQKDNVKIQGMIQKLQGILKEEATAEQPPPLAPLVEKQDVKTVLSAGFLNIVKDSDSLEFACRVPSCLFTSKDREKFVKHWTEDHSKVTLHFKHTKCRICQKEISATADTTLLINFFLHVEEQHLGSARRNVLSIRRLSGDKLSTTKEETAEDFDIKSDDNPFGFKISGVMSLAEDPLPPLSPIVENKSPKIESVVLKESKMTATEKAAVWKCSEAMKKFLQCPRELYKCPQFFCKFATSWRHLFEGHIKAHAALSDELVSCVYCDVKSPLSHAGLHIDLRHSNCLYSCSQCLYRALKREYVVIHMKLKHKEGDSIVSLPPKTAKTIMMTKQKRFGVKETCQPYKCGFAGCHAEFLYQNEFAEHFESSHDGVMMCGFRLNKVLPCSYKCVIADDIIDHWSSHNCYTFHCLICKTGSMEMYTMLEHYATNHQSVEPLVVDRRRNPGNAPAGYSDEACAKIRYVVDELLESVNTHQIAVVSAEKPAPGAEATKSVAVVPISPEKKIIAIFPKKADNKLLGALTPPPLTAEPSFVFASIPEDESAKDKEEAARDDEQSRADDADARGDDPLSLDGSVLVSGDESDSQDVAEMVLLKSFGLIGYQLYRCAFCDISFSNARDFKAHCMHSKQCRDASSALKPFKCVHCERFFKNPHGLLEHIQYHGQLRFCCSLCTQKFPSTFSLKLHMRNKHNVTSTVTTPLITNKNNLERDEFLMRPVPVVESESSRDSPNAKSFSGEKNMFSPDEIDQLPKRYIFNSDVNCALCSYSTKVRTNLVRHLQFHASERSVPDMAPVNPVPCLDKNEKMFDKMTNLALSSFTGSNSGRMVKAEPKEKEQVQLPAYIPTHRRYVCCASGCNYLCLEEANLRHHLHALHAQEPSFTCAHCKSSLKTDVDGFLKHLKLHDLHLYKCSHCHFVHNLRHKVDKHCNDKHPDKIQRTITVRALEAEPDAAAAEQGAEAPLPPPSNIKWTKPWHCGMCKYRCAAKSDIVAHIFNKHDIDTQFKCTLCSYKSNEKSTFGAHFKEAHPSSDIDVIHVYYKSEGAAQTATSAKQFDTTPLWQRDRPRVRHIRGILFEESASPQKEAKKGKGGVAVAKASTSSSAASNLDLAIDAVAKGLDDASKSAEKVDVIVIDDDEEEDDDNDGELLIDVEGDSNEEKVKEEMPETPLLSEEALIAKYGSLGAIGNKGFKCPICLKFQTKKIAFFVYHLLKELKCYRFKCKSCDFGSVTFDTMVFHCQEEHNSAIASNVSDVPVEQTIEYWLQLVVQHQAKSLVATHAPPSGDELQVGVTKMQCDFCQKWFKNNQVFKEHELLHWAEHGYVCGHCRREEATMDELLLHSSAAHPASDCALESRGPDLGKLIAQLKSPPAMGPAKQPLASEESGYSCLKCGAVDKNLEALQKHYIEAHKGSVEDFQFKEVAMKGKTNCMFCCTYCHEKGTEKQLAKHHQENHFNLKPSVYQYICLECSGTFYNVKELRGHYAKTHPGKKVTYSCIENKPTQNDVYCCTKCPFRSGSVGGIRGHLRKHLRPIDCLLCGATFIYPTEARAHHNKGHLHNTEAVEENKERLKEYEDLVQEIVAAARQREERPAPPRRMLARKSTGAPFVREYSFYGAKAEQADLKSISTSIEVNNVTTKITAEQFSNIFNIFPVVDVEDCCQSSGS